MKKSGVLITCVAVLVFSGLAVASASATQWLKAGEGITKPVAFNVDWSVVLIKAGGSLGSGEVECNGVFVGTAGAGAAGEITEVTSLTGTEKGLIACTRLSGFCFNPVFHFEKLPWKTELVLEGGVTWSKIVGGALQFLCAIGSVLCAGEEKAKFIKNGVSGAELVFEGAASGESSCSDGGIFTIKGKGTALGITVS